jgi:hypothetical protein
MAPPSYADTLDPNDPESVWAVATPAPEWELLVPLVSQRRADLQKEARELGRKLYAEPDDEFVERIHGYWKAWR